MLIIRWVIITKCDNAKGKDGVRGLMISERDYLTAHIDILLGDKVEADELIDVLIADEYTHAWIYWADLPTDDDDTWMTERLILDADGNIIARQICPPLCYGWSQVTWSLRPPLFPIPNNVMELDLNDRDEAISTVLFFGNI
ncbi:hypothetical protein HA50_26090 [Pantoea cypripedii]|uniref:Uncharacterized protein n=2 Tax=Pantoea cypripedii TaxID=55209 RepID=A0A1X1EME3_PANCY|nr:hypothetical protein HA50_26090 [Pantoea cypripedii]